MTAPRSAVVRLPNWVGDVVMALPVLTRLRRLWPETRLDVQVHDRARLLVEGRHGIGRVHRVPRRGEAGWGEVLEGLRAGRYEAGLLLTPSFSSALLFFLGGVADRIGWRGEMRDVLLTRPLPRPGRTARLVPQYQALLAPLGDAGPAERAVFTPQPGDRAAATGWLAGRGLSPGEAVALAPAAAHGGAKRWPAPAYGALAAALVARGTPVILVGGPLDEAILDEVGRTATAAGAPRGSVHIMAGDLELPATGALLGMCRGLVGNDTGPFHLGRAAGAPVVGLFGSTTPDWTGPEPEEGEVLYRRLACSPCYARECPLHEDRLACLTGIGVDQVLAALDRVMAAAEAGGRG